MMTSVSAAMENEPAIVADPDESFVANKRLLRGK
jgi:hypothetical protein